VTEEDRQADGRVAVRAARVQQRRIIREHELRSRCVAERARFGEADGSASRDEETHDLQLAVIDREKHRRRWFSSTVNTAGPPRQRAHARGIARFDRISQFAIRAMVRLTARERALRVSRMQRLRARSLKSHSLTVSQLESSSRRVVEESSTRRLETRRLDGETVRLETPPPLPAADESSKSPQIPRKLYADEPNVRV
jgi:hypothetical protein